MRITTERKLVGNAAADTSRRHHRVIRDELLRVIPEEEKARGLAIYNKGQKATVFREIYRSDKVHFGATRPHGLLPGVEVWCPIECQEYEDVD